MGFQGIDIRQRGDRLLFDALIMDADGAIVTSAGAVLRLYELQNDGTLKSYDFNSNTFKTTALTTETLSMTHRQGNNATVNTGLHTVALTTVSGFTEGGIYYARVDHASGFPTQQMRKFMYGSKEHTQIHEIDQAVLGKVTHDYGTGVSVVKDEDGTTTLATRTPAVAGDVVTLTRS